MQVLVSFDIEDADSETYDSVYEVLAVWGLEREISHSHLPDTTLVGDATVFGNDTKEALRQIKSTIQPLAKLTRLVVGITDDIDYFDVKQPRLVIGLTR